MNGLLIAAPNSGAGKTTVTLGILRALSRQGHNIASAKSGPDFIDPQFHHAATGKPCETLDAWAMPANQLQSLATSSNADLLIVEGAMGLFDGAASSGSGSSADLAESLNIPVLLVIDCARMSQSVAALVSGFVHHRKSLSIAALILNNVGSERHETMLREALAPLEIPILGALPRNPNLKHPSRHLGLMQAEERDDLEQFLDLVGDEIVTHIDLSKLTDIAQALPNANDYITIPPLGQRIAIARDQAFRFAYPHLLRDWRNRKAALSFFSPLANEAPNPDSDAVYIPGGYPELHAATLAKADTFKSGLRRLSKSAQIYGECGGYMVLGEGLTDAKGVRHEMCGLLQLETSFETPKRHLGYRQIKGGHGPLKGRFKAHEFHYSSALCEEGTALYETWDAQGNELGSAGLIHGNVSGSYMHLIAHQSP